MNYIYYSNINKKLKQINLNEIQKEYLYYFAFNPHTSPYDIAIEKKINDFDAEIKKLNTTTYKKTKIIAKQLYELKLIDYDKTIEEKSTHKKKNYYLTELGVYYIMKHPIFLKINIQYIIKSILI